MDRAIREQYFPLARGCYERLLERDGQARGRIRLAVVVAPGEGKGGVVESVMIREGATLEDVATRSCLRDAMFRVKFDAPRVEDERRAVRFPFDFVYPLEFAP